MFRELLCLSLFVFFMSCAAPQQTLAGSGYTYFQSLTGDDSDSDKSRWDTAYGKSKGYVFGREPVAFLAENLNLLPVGRVLDIAMGEGRNAVFLAKKGFDVLGVDISEVAVRKAKRLAQEHGVHLRTVTVDLNTYQIPPESYDVILMFYYVQSSLTAQIVRGLKPGGVLVYENYTTDQIKHDKLANPALMLKKGEARTLFLKDLTEVKYLEHDDGKQATVSFIGRKPVSAKK